MWPHLALSYVAGAFALLSYLARWSPKTGPGRSPKVPPARLVSCRAALQGKCGLSCLEEGDVFASAVHCCRSALAVAGAQRCHPQGW